ncbi:4Fe-4S single cluster domain-containing protein [Spirulina sp. 06S082]|uniref:4Fe-4S single cluster domain-containing protein n=1 Tax=Spirulina sp. 06S082 TaxID=3110248 RepID=UPI002B1F9D47|nr:4Fe-4S single cluster domain-containing protein [Spirulina sp. 06S082]MEA5470780.1 4Fe-4S single cluster domain-containing protein [Spirulina sp. 06S082]
MNQTVFLPQSIEAYNSLQKIPPDHLNIMGSVNDTQFYGLDSWAMVLVQGCLQRFQSCVDPKTWSFEINKLVSVEKLAAKVLSNPCNQGVILSGGEPFWQARSLVKLAREMKANGLFVISFTGFTLEKLASPTAPLGARELIDWLDILIAGPYLPSLAISTPDSPLSSRNQRVHIFNSALKDKISWGDPQAETNNLPEIFR